MTPAIALNLALPVYRHVRAMPADSPAVCVDERTYTYSQLASTAAKVASWLNARCKPGKPPRVGVLAARSWQTYTGILGTVWAGGHFIPLHPRQPAARLKQILQQTEMDALIVEDKSAARVAELEGALPPNVLVGDEWKTLEALDELHPVPVSFDDIAYIIFTSGTTGTPKGVMVSVANMNHYLGALRSMYHFGPGDRVAQFFENTFDPSIHEMFSTWDGGAALHVVPETKLMAPGGFIREHAITVWQSVPSVVVMMNKFKQLEPGSMPSLRITNFGGEGAPVASMQAWQKAAPSSVVDNQYGPTEATIACMWHRLSENPDITPGRGTLAIGKPYPEMEGAIVGPEGQFLAPGQSGELALRGPQIALGYFNDPAKTAARFPTLDHPKLGKTRWYLTGDLALQDEKGLFHCLGRVDNQVKINGFRVELEEIESHLRSICQTDDVAAVAWPLLAGAAANNAAGVVAFISGARVGPGEVREGLKGRVPHYMVPTRVMEMASLPLSTNGKVDRKALVKLLEDKSTGAIS